MYGTRQYNIWCGMKRRCYNKNEKTYKKYGKVGIKMSDSWKNSFLSFWTDMKNEYFEEAQIDRIDNNKGYSKKNCRWATIKEQANNKRNVTLYSYNGKIMNAYDWDKELGLKKGTVRARIKTYKWDIEKALSSSKKKYKGYFFDKNRKNYRVEIKIKGERHFVGRFNTAVKAKKAREEFLYNLLK